MHPDEQRFADHIRSLIARAEMRRGRARTDNEARAWQQEILRLQALLSVELPWPMTDAALLAAHRGGEAGPTAEALRAEIERRGLEPPALPSGRR